MKRPMAWVGLSFFSALILFCIYGLWAAIAGGLVSLCLLLLFLCIPCWAWLALLGLGLIVAGALLLRLSKAWR